MLKYNKFPLKINKLNLANDKNLYAIATQQNSTRFKSTATGVVYEREDDIKSTTGTEWQSAKSYQDIPTVGKFSLIKNFLPGGKYYKLDSKQFLNALEKEFGSIFKLPGFFGRPDVIYTHNVQDFETIYRNEGIWPRRPSLMTLRHYRSVHRAEFFEGAKGLLSGHGEEWGKLRTLMNPILMQPQNVKLYLNKMSQVNKEFIERVRQIRDPNTLEVPANFEEELNRFTLESISVVALDQQLGLLNESGINPKAKLMFTSLTDYIARSWDLELKPSIWKYYETRKFKQLMNNCDILLDITNSFISEAIERLEQERKNSGTEKADCEQSVLEKLIKIDKKIASVMAMDMFFAGVDTTSSTLAGILLSLAQNPDKQAKLREEVMRILPHKDSEFSEESFKNMTYLRAFIKESLRYYPIMLGILRTPAKDVVLSGYRVPKDTRVTMVSVSLMHKEEHFGRPSEFLPERWLRAQSESHANDLGNEGTALKPKCPFIYLPFGFGPRICIGRRIVDMELELGVARIVRNFNVDFKYPTENAFKSLLINVPNIPLKFKFTDVEY